MENEIFWDISVKHVSALYHSDSVQKISYASESPIKTLSHTKWDYRLQKDIHPPETKIDDLEFTSNENMQHDPYNHNIYEPRVCKSCKRFNF